MKNLNPYIGSAETFFDNIIAGKKDVALILRLSAAKPKLVQRYQIYDTAFASNHLESITPEVTSKDIMEDGKKIYKYDSLAIRNFVENVGQLQPITVRYRCQYCTVTPNESLDHYLPQSTYPEFSIHPRNLVPCCKTCNGYKSNTFVVNGKRQFIDFYLDQLPQIQYLFASIIVTTQYDIEIQFYLENTANLVPFDTFQLIETHFKKLHLLERMRKASLTEIAEFVGLMDEYSKRLSQQETIDEVLRLTAKNKSAYGVNYYMAILKEAIVSNSNFMSCFQWT